MSFCGKNAHTNVFVPPYFGKNSVVANHSSLEMNEEREDLYDSKNCKGIDSYGFTTEQYDIL